MYRVLLAAAALSAALSVACEAGGYDNAYAPEPGYRHHFKRAHAHRWWAVKPYHMGAGGLLVVDEPYGEWIHEHAVRTRDDIRWAR